MMKLDLDVLQREFAKHFPNRRVGVKENHLITYPNLVSQLFPDAVKIIMVRNPTSVSISKLHGSRAIDKCGVVLLRMSHALRAWPNVPNTTIIRYENFVRRPEKYLREVIAKIDPSIRLANLPPVAVETGKNRKWERYNKGDKSKIAEMCSETQNLLDEMFPLEE